MAPSPFRRLSQSMRRSKSQPFLRRHLQTGPHPSSADTPSAGAAAAAAIAAANAKTLYAELSRDGDSHRTPRARRRRHADDQFTSPNRMNLRPHVEEDIADQLDLLDLQGQNNNNKSSRRDRQQRHTLSLVDLPSPFASPRNLRRRRSLINPMPSPVAPPYDEPYTDVGAQSPTTFTKFGPCANPCPQGKENQQYQEYGVHAEHESAILLPTLQVLKGMHDDQVDIDLEIFPRRRRSTIVSTFAPSPFYRRRGNHQRNRYFQDNQPLPSELSMTAPWHTNAVPTTTPDMGTGSNDSDTTTTSVTQSETPEPSDLAYNQHHYQDQLEQHHHHHYQHHSTRRYVRVSVADFTSTVPRRPSTLAMVRQPEKDVNQHGDKLAPPPAPAPLSSKFQKTYNRRPPAYDFMSSSPSPSSLRAGSAQDSSLLSLDIGTRVEETNLLQFAPAAVDRVCGQTCSLAMSSGLLPSLNDPCNCIHDSRKTCANAPLPAEYDVRDACHEMNDPPLTTFNAHGLEEDQEELYTMPDLLTGATNDRHRPSSVLPGLEYQQYFQQQYSQHLFSPPRLPSLATLSSASQSPGSTLLSTTMSSAGGTESSTIPTDFTPHALSLSLSLSSGGRETLCTPRKHDPLQDRGDGHVANDEDYLLLPRDTGSDDNDVPSTVHSLVNAMPSVEVAEAAIMNGCGYEDTPLEVQHSLFDIPAQEKAIIQDDEDLRTATMQEEKIGMNRSSVENDIASDSCVDVTDEHEAGNVNSNVSTSQGQSQGQNQKRNIMVSSPPSFWRHKMSTAPRPVKYTFRPLHKVSTKDLSRTIDTDVSKNNTGTGEVHNEHNNNSEGAIIDEISRSAPITIQVQSPPCPSATSPKPPPQPKLVIQAPSPSSPQTPTGPLQVAVRRRHTTDGDDLTSNATSNATSSSGMNNKGLMLALTRRVKDRSTSPPVTDRVAGTCARRMSGASKNKHGKLTRSPTPPPPAASSSDGTTPRSMFRKTWIKRASNESNVTSLSLSQLEGDDTTTEYYQDEYTKFIENKKVKSTSPLKALLPHPGFARLVGEGRHLRASKLECRTNSTISVSTSDEEYRPY